MSPIFLACTHVMVFCLGALSARIFDQWRTRRCSR